MTFAYWILPKKAEPVSEKAGTDLLENILLTSTLNNPRSGNPLKLSLFLSGERSMQRISTFTHPCALLSGVPIQFPRIVCESECRRQKIDLGIHFYQNVETASYGFLAISGMSALLSRASVFLN
jgi:hypothetical protein